MDYLVGSAFTLLLTYFVFRHFLGTLIPTKKIQIRYCQSDIHEQVKHLIPPQSMLKKRNPSQSTIHRDKHNVRVIIIENNAYWITDNKFFTAKVGENGIDRDMATVVDTMAMDKVELDKMLFIMDKLREGRTHDSGGSGNK